ncbi:TPA: GDSL family lipase [Candidatus Poribacteria bacterium]|nr:GDSL family lipase [Candidatus Poribacteria bacterium]
MDNFLFQDGQKVVFIGDSITDCGRRGNFAPFGNGYVKFAIDLITARYPERHITYFNEGIGGNTVLDLHNRWNSDVLAHKPDWLTVKIGINDLHRTLGQTQALPSEKYEQLYREILQLAREQTQARLVLIDPFYVSAETDTNTQQGLVLSMLTGYLDVVEKLAKEFDALHVYTHEKFQGQLRHRPAGHFCPEPVHPYLSGHIIIALALLEALGW